MKLLVRSLLFLISCLSFAQNPNDCVNAIVICGDSSIGLEPNGIGFDEFSLPGNNQPECYFFDQHNIWFKFEIIEGGTFMFDIIPDDGADYDFAIFGADVDCTTLGSSIRCSSTNPEDAGVSANTGLNLEETDTNEGPGLDGNGYLRYIDAQAGDIYYLLVDRAVGSGGLGLFYTGTATLPTGVIANTVADQQNCFPEFNLDLLIPDVQGSQTNTTVTFHTSLNDANIGINELSSPYTSTSSPQTIYARIESPNGCTDFTSFTIDSGFPELNILDDVVKCSVSPSFMYNLNEIIPEISIDPSGYIFTFHTSQNDADTNINPIGSELLLTETSQTIYIRVTDENDSTCYGTTFFSAYIILSHPANRPSNMSTCDDDFDGISSFNFSEKDSEVIGNLPPGEFQVFYYVSATDQQNDTNRISGSFQNTSSPQIIFASLYENATGCLSFTNFRIYVYPKPSVSFENESYLYCLNATEPLELTVEGLYSNYSWSNGEEGRDKRTISVTEPGIYSVTATNRYGCTDSGSVEVIGSDIATITNVEIVDFHSPKNSITITAEGLGDYEYALNNTSYFRDSPTFEGLTNGYLTVYVRDKNGCGTISQEVLILDYMKFFTPNEDGYHDFWQITGIKDFPNSNIYIFDRFGKLLKEIAPDSEGWDGTNDQGDPLPSNDYWFRLELEDGRAIRRHFTLKR